MKVTRNRVLEVVAVTVLLATYLGMTVSSSRHKSVTFDGLLHLTGGVSYWKHNDYRLQPENGNLPQRWMALPVVMGNFRFPSTDNRYWQESRQYEFGRQFFYGEGNSAEAMLLRGRSAVTLLGVAVGLVVYLWSRRLFGVGGGMVSLVLWVFSPTSLAHGGLLTSDMAAALLFAAALGCFWAVLQKVSATRVAFSALMMAGLFLTKMSAPLVVPVVLVLMGMRVAKNHPLPIGFGAARDVVRQGRQVLVLTGVLVAHAVVIFTLIWAAYGFRYSAIKSPALGRGRLDVVWSWQTLEEEPRVGPVIRFARTHRVLPEAYIYGYGHVYMKSSSPKTVLFRRAFFNGEFSSKGWVTFFPYCFLVKTPLPVLAVLLLAMAATVWTWRLRQDGDTSSTRSRIAGSLYQTAPLWLFMTLYWTTLVTGKLNIGHRHLLPVYPMMFILAGAAACWLKRRFRWITVVLLVVLAALVAESLSTWPHYLAYFNQVVGGSANGYKHLVDSSLDWGQDLPGLKAFIDAERKQTGPETPVYISYFGNGSLAYYGIDAFLLPCSPGGWQVGKKLDRPRDGIYCISATMLQNVYTACSGPWAGQHESAYWGLKQNTESFQARARIRVLPPVERAEMKRQLHLFDQLRFARLCACLRNGEPDDTVGYSILIYRLTDDEVSRALREPVADFTRTPRP